MAHSMPLLLVSGALALGLTGTATHADQARSFVSQVLGFGDDAHAPDCTRSAPCAHFQVAHDHTLDDGEITVLDPGSYGSLTITKNISVINDGVGETGILVSGGGIGITINAPAGAAVTLRGLTIKGIGFGGGDGILFNSGAALNVENCSIRNLDGAGHGNAIRFLPSTTSHLAVSNTIITDNASAGVIVSPAGAVGVRAELDRVQILRSGGAGLLVFGSSSAGVRITVTDSQSAFNGQGFVVQSNAAATTLEVVRSVASHNATGLLGNDASATLLVGRSVVTGNGVTWHVNTGAAVFSFVDNYMFDNDDGSPAPPPASPH